MRILHLADVHLDRPLKGLPLDAARRRRVELFDTFRRCLELAQEHNVDLVTIGGDLWDRERVSLDTVKSVAHELDLLGRPVLMIAGNHDPLVAGGSYDRVRWPVNVTLIRANTLERHDYGDVCVWGISWTGGRLTDSFFDDFVVPDDGKAHVLLVHGTTGPLAHLVENGDCTFESRRVRVSGFKLCLAGHIHAASYEAGVVYPGSPEPLAWDETHRHCVALVDIDPQSVAVELVDVNQKRYETREVVCTGCGSSAEIIHKLEEAAGDTDSAKIFLKLRLVGEVDPDCVNGAGPSADIVARYATVRIEDATEPLFDAESGAVRPGLAGLFARMLQERTDAAGSDIDRRELQLALEAGLRAIRGLDQVLRVD